MNDKMQEIPELLQTLLAKRGLTDDAAIAAFLAPEYEAHTHDPFLLNDMPQAVDRVLRAIEGGEKIAVYSDFDCDGIPAAALLADFFAKIEYENVETYIPHRDREGYGFHAQAVEKLAARGVKLIITADLGITAVAQVEVARGLGVDVIVTDHHEVMGDIPKALAVVNPKLASYPFADLCGAAVAFKLVQALIVEGKRRESAMQPPSSPLNRGVDAESPPVKGDLGGFRFTPIPDGWEKWLLDLVAIATIADMVPLIGENRALAFWGMRVLRKTPRPGINALCIALKLKKSELSEDDIGFSIGPRINAASRMGDPDVAFRLLSTHDSREAEMLAAQLEHLNAQRKGVVAGIVKQARAAVNARFEDDAQVVVVGNPDWKPTLLGLAANSALEGRKGMVCLWGRDAMGELKGSCRSDGSVSIADVFARSGDIFEACGGHECAGGFTVSHEKVHTLAEELAKKVDDIERESTRKEVVAQGHDADLHLHHVSWSTFAAISQLSPFGAGNPKPIFRIAGVVSSVRTFGKEKNHVEITIHSESATVRAFQFFKSASDFTHTPKAGNTVYLIATLERDSYRGPTNVALRVKDVLQ